MLLTPVMLVHVLAASSAIVGGAAMLMLKKGTRLHRLLGRAWIALMLLAVLMSFGIQTRGHPSWLHLLSLAVLLTLGRAIYAVMHGNIRTHRRAMISLYVSLLAAGLFTLMPGRRFGNLAGHALGWL